MALLGRNELRHHHRDMVKVHKLYCICGKDMRLIVALSPKSNRLTTTSKHKYWSQWRIYASAGPHGSKSQSIVPVPELGIVWLGIIMLKIIYCVKHWNQIGIHFCIGCNSCSAIVWYNANNIWVRSRNCGCLVTWFCYQLIAKPGNKTAPVAWPDPYYENADVHVKGMNWR